MPIIGKGAARILGIDIEQENWQCSGCGFRNQEGYCAVCGLPYEQSLEGNERVSRKSECKNAAGQTVPLDSQAAGSVEFRDLSQEAQTLIVDAAMGVYDDKAPGIPETVKDEIRRWAESEIQQNTTIQGERSDTLE